jgi:hypothetical protein
MATQVRLFVSAGPAEEPLRELIGRALAELPVNIGWIIKRTPDVDSVPECHLFTIVLGRDIVAPAGLELWWARRTEKPVIGYLLEGRRTPAGQVFMQDNMGIDWTRFRDTADLRRVFLKDVARFLLAHAERYGVTVAEAETLGGMMASLDKTPPGKAAGLQGDEIKLSGAGGGGVILAPGKDIPRGAHLLGEE